MDREWFLSELAVDVALGPSCAALLTAVTLDDVGNLPIEIVAFGVGKELLVGILGGTLERDVNIPGPDALKIRLAPRGLQIRFAGRGERQSRHDDRQRRYRRRRQHAGQQKPSDLLAHGKRLIVLRLEVGVTNSISILCGPTIFGGSG